MAKTPDYKAAVEHLKSSDAKLRKLIEKVGEPTIKLRHSHTIFYALMRAIIYQQLAGAAASAIMGRVEALADGYEMTPEQLLSLPDERLRGAGLSKNKMAALRDLSAKVLDGTVPTAREMSRMDEEEIIERITQVRGIGRWTVEMLLIFRLGKMDILPLDDFGVRKGFQKAYKLKDMPTKKELAARGARWSPWRSVASWYLWRSCEMKDAKPAKVKKAAKVLTS
jgi:3-methyladenine DNA glycosylase/8-oxoguanine DNA glycosylase